MSLKSRQGGLPGQGSRLNVEWPAKANDTVIVRGARDIPLRHALATGYVVSGCRGRQRMVLTVCCPYCDLWHAHTAKTTFRAGVRTAACRRGRYVVSVGAVEGLS